ncbi:type VI secretion protein [Dyadobacter flavalbus]|uniref:Type VI secretion protein n=1 Tax=Dyadobacter flavalbus TaxID=2579942 RepID=A0A5M8QYP1_9BACT|nr:PAAR domain-containing protein [Dyadobacter flavalbus]KAA6439533.1 type VI secretion protein [Dyadobacter flavalbus]
MGLPAARAGDMHVCPMITALVPHVGGPVMPPGVSTVLIGGMPAATVTSLCTCAGPPDMIAVGSGTVLIGGKPAARVGDTTAHGGTILQGCMTVLIG